MIKEQDFCKNCEHLIKDVFSGDTLCEFDGECENLLQTNEEWFCSLSTEEKADKLTDFSFWLVPNIPTEDKREQVRKKIVEWLKEIHNG